MWETRFFTKIGKKTIQISAHEKSNNDQDIISDDGDDDNDDDDDGDNDDDNDGFLIFKM